MGLNKDIYMSAYQEGISNVEHARFIGKTYTRYTRYTRYKRYTRYTRYRGRMGMMAREQKLLLLLDRV